MYAVAMAPNDANGPPSGRRGCRRARTDAGGSSAKYAGRSQWCHSSLFRSRPVAVSVSVGFTFTIGFYGLVFLLSF